MPTVVFESPHAPPLVVETPTGARLVDVCDEHDAPVPFSCRGASCGTCRIDVIEGGDQLELPRDDELELLELMGDDPARCRLACQARLRGEGLVRIRPAGDW
ncbi:MAG: (2Fe-2S)-binding protein [Polyangiaceae bacterium]|nr:(2Fe-2S)-binding protein [Polyangiaceae bacterium]